MDNYTAEQLHLMRLFGRGDLAGDLDWLLAIAAEHAPGERDLEDLRSRFANAIDIVSDRDLGKLGSINSNQERSEPGSARRKDVARLYPSLRKSHGAAEAKRQIAAKLNVEVRTIRRDLARLALD